MERLRVELGGKALDLIFVHYVRRTGEALADMQVFDSRGLDVTGAGFRTAPTGEALPGRRIGPLAPGKYSLVVMRKDKQDLRQELSVGGEPTKAVHVRCD